MDPTEDTPTGSESEAATTFEPDSGEVVELDALESDMAAVEQAITTLDEISSRGVGGELAANEIAAAVSKERFVR